jgi:hypothetical protein
LNETLSISATASGPMIERNQSAIAAPALGETTGMKTNPPHINMTAAIPTTNIRSHRRRLRGGCGG